MDKIQLIHELGTANNRIAELEATLADALRHWQQGIGELNNKWRIRMGEILGDAEGLAEEAALADFEKKKTT